MKKWVKQEVNFLDIRAIYTDITTNQRIQKTRLGQCLVYNTNKICEEPTDIFVPKVFEGWDFYAGGNIVDEDEDEAIYSYGHYCCDGDGFVSVLLLVDGTIQLLDQGDYMLDLSPNLDEAMKQATEYLQQQLPELYDMWLAPLRG
jgi:hypothetical protein